MAVLLWFTTFTSGHSVCPAGAVARSEGESRQQGWRALHSEYYNKPGFPIWIDCRPHDDLHAAARPVGQLVNTSQHVNGSHLATLGDLCPRRSRDWSFRTSRAETPLPH